MKILMVSMNSIHFRRWTMQLEDAGHEVFWFDIKDQGYIPSLSWVTQITGWKKGFLKRRGRTFLKKNLPKIYNFLSKTFDTTIEKTFEKALQEIKPDCVHSFALYVSCTPIYEVMVKNTIPWIYSSWGSDLFYFKEVPHYREDIERVLPRINFMFSDCKRDHHLAKDLGFKGKHLGVVPGGGGFDIDQSAKHIQPLKERTVILVKGYQGRSGRAIPVIKALKETMCYQNYNVIVFGADPDVIAFCNNEQMEITLHSSKNPLSHEEILKLMGRALVYVGNSNSDGMPNTLLEAMIMGAFPIQSNPGGASAEVIDHEKNGLLIEDCEDSQEIKILISKALEDDVLLEKAQLYNMKLRESLSFEHIKERVLRAYDIIN